MKFIDAIKLAEKNSHLIGKKFKGSRINEIIVYPTNEDAFDAFSKQYIRLDNAQEAIASFMNNDVSVGVVTNKNWIKTKLLFLHTDIANLPVSLGAFLDID